jgi:hypothetical protein
MHRLAGIPAVLIHGRYDVSGPLDTAWQLHQSWADSQLVVLDDAGHGGGSFTNELVGALDSWLTVSVSRAALAPRRLRPTGFASTHRARRADRREHGRQFARSKRGRPRRLVNLLPVCW